MNMIEVVVSVVATVLKDFWNDELANERCLKKLD
jgi:hypothetical protein